MLGAFVDVELLDDGAAKGAFRKHAPDGALDELDGEFFLHDACGTGAEAAVILRDVVVVLLALGVIAGELDFGSVDHDDVVAAIDVRGVDGLIFAHEDDRKLGSKAAKRDIRGIDEEPVALDRLFLRHGRLTLHGVFSFCFVLTVVRTFNFTGVYSFKVVPCDIIRACVYECKRRFFGCAWCTEWEGSCSELHKTAKSC